MSEAELRSLERRVLVLAPVGKDAALIQSALLGSGLACHRCRDVQDVLAEAKNGIGALLLAEEALLRHQDDLVQWMHAQPPWSDLPVLLLSRIGSSSHIVEQALQRLGNVTLLERPVRVAALVSAARSALRARERQYLSRQHLREREEANQRKDQFLATLAHELRNPLAPIRNGMQLLRVAPSAQTVTTVCDMLERQLNQLLRLVDDLMEVSRTTRGKIALQRARIDLADAIRTAVETTRPLIDAARHQLSVRLPRDPLYVMADGVRLGQVFSNLLNNAAKYTNDGGRIAITAWRDGGDAVTAVVDSGIGIPQEAVRHVFELFAQVDAYDIRTRGGLGIGLTLARSLVEMHGGTLTVTSDGIGRGSSFEVRLPLTDAVEDSRTEPQAPAPRGNGTHRILVVDDNRDAADSLAVLLRALGNDVRVEYNGEAALATCVAFAPGVAVLDLGMPGMSGYELAERLRERNGSAPVLMALTGWGQDQDRRRSAAAGFDHHLLKPLDIGQLEALLAEIPAR